MNSFWNGAKVAWEHLELWQKLAVVAVFSVALGLALSRL